MKDYIVNRVNEISDFVIETKATVREVSDYFPVSKSTVHRDITERLSRVNPKKAETVDKILKNNQRLGRLKGGQTTRQKYKGGGLNV